MTATMVNRVKNAVLIQKGGGILPNTIPDILLEPITDAVVQDVGNYVENYAKK